MYNCESRLQKLHPNLWKLEEYSFNISNKNKAECRILKRLQYKGGPLSKQVIPGPLSKLS
jgi:hypothetical protein